MIYFKNVTKTRNIGICSLELFNCVFIVKSTNYVCIAIIVSQGLLCSVSRSLCASLTFHDSFFKIFGTVCTRGGLLKKTAAVYMFSLYPLKLSEGKKRKILKVREELRLGTCQSAFFFAFGAAAVANCYRATLCLAEQKNIFLHFVQKYQDITAHSFHFWHFFPVEDLREKRRKF